VTEFLALAGYPAASLLEVRKEQKGKYFFLAIARGIFYTNSVT
tara:strand:+ start:308 stop:436 length:129 start_codon:yes stop_codon:yes gene_type:complete